MTQIVKKLWEELSNEEQSKFIKMMDFVGYPAKAGYERNAYQIKDGNPHGFIDGYRSTLIKSRAKAS